MRYLGTDFTLVLGAWRLRLAIALEDDDDVEPVVRPVASRPKCSDFRVRRPSAHRP